MCAKEVNYQQYGMTTAQWNVLPQVLKDICSKNDKAVHSIMKQIEMGNDPKELAAKLSGQKSANAETPEAKAEAKITGLSIESADAKSAQIKSQQLIQKDLKALDELKPSLEPDAIKNLENDKKVQKAREKTWTEYFTARYENNPEELKDDYIKITKRLKINKMAAQMMQAAKLDPILMKTKYFSEGHATPEEKKLLDQLIEEGRQDFSKPGNETRARNEYNNMMKNLTKKNPVGTGETLTKAQIEELALFKAFNQFEIGTYRIKQMAQNVVEQQHFNKAVFTIAEYEGKINEQKAKLETKQSMDARRKFAKEDVARQNEITKIMREAETEASLKVRKDFQAKDDEFAAKIEKAKLEGKKDEALELMKQRAEHEKKTLIDLNKALDPEKKAQADKLATERMAKLKEFNEKLPSLQDSKVQEKINKLIKERDEKVNKIAKEEAEDFEKFKKLKPAEFAKMMAAAQVDKEIAKDRIANTVVHWNNDDEKTIDKKDGKNHTFPFKNEETREYIIANGDKFGKPCADGEKGDYEFDGKQYKFDSDMYKARMVQIAGDHGLDNKYAKDEMYKADLYTQLYDKKEFIDRRVNDEERSVQKTDKQQINLKERRMARDMMEAAGLDVEKDQTVAKRWANAGLDTVGGAAAFAAPVLFQQWVSTMPEVEKAYAKLVKFSGVIPYKGLVKYDKTHNVTVTGQGTMTGQGSVTGMATVTGQTSVTGMATVTGQTSVTGMATVTGQTSVTGTATVTGQTSVTGMATVTGDTSLTGQVSLTGNVSGTTGYSTQVTAQGIASGQVGIDFSKTYDYENSGVLSGTFTGEAGYSGQKTVTLGYTDEYTYYNNSEVYNNGRLTSSISTPHTGTVSGTTSGVVDYSGTVQYSQDYNLPYTVKGQIDVNETVYGQANIPYSQTIDVNGTTTFSTQATFTDNVTLTGQGTVTGQATVQGQGTVTGQATVTGQGTITGQATVTGQGTITGQATVTGQGTVTGKTTVQGQGTMTGKGTVTGDARIQDEFIHEDEVEVSEKDINKDNITIDKDINWKMVGGAAIMGGVTGLMNALREWNSTFDDTDSKYAVIRGIVGEKNVDYVPKEQPKTNPEPLVAKKQTFSKPAPVPSELPTLKSTPVTSTQPVEGENDCYADVKEYEIEIPTVEDFKVGTKNLKDIIAKKYGIKDDDDLEKAVGVVKGWHGITENQRKENYWIDTVGLRETLPIPGGKTYGYVAGVDRDSILDNTNFNAKAKGYGKYATIKVVAGKVILSCDGSEYKYESLNLAEKVKEFYNKNKRMPLDHELADLKKQK